MPDKIFLFVGERRSPKAVQMDVRWEDEALAARPLFDALRRWGVDPSQQRYINLFHEDVTGPFRVNPDSAPIVREAMPHCEIVAMGSRVSQALDKLEIPHTRIVHPAARGKIRKRDTYVQHVGITLGLM